MIDFLTYVFSEAKARRLTNAEALALITQYQGSHARGRMLHPLVHCNTSDLHEQRFSSTFSGNEFFLKDHVVQGQRVLPGVAHLEMARAAVRLAVSEQEAGREVRLEKVVFARPVVVGDKPLDVHIALDLQADAGIAFEIYSGTGDDAIVHSQGRAVLVQPQPTAALDLASWQARCAHHGMQAEACYRAFAQAGLAYGPTFQSVQRISAGQDSAGQPIALGELKLPAAAADGSAAYALHPSLMDAALQSSVGLMLGEASDSGNLALPFALERLEMFAPLPEQVWALARYSAGSHAGAAVQKLDIDLVDADGRVCVKIGGFSSRVVQGAPAAQTVLLRPQWQSQAVIADETPPDYAAHWVVLCEADAQVRAIEAGLRGAHCVQLSSPASTLAQRYTDYAQQLLEQVQAIFAAKPQGDVLLQVVVPAQGESAVLRGLGGLLKSAQQEYQKLRAQVLAVENGLDTQALCACLREQMPSPAPEVRYLHGERQMLRLEEADQAAPATPAWKDSGVYLITGGAGGLGLLFAEDIAARARDVQLILTGRSPSSEAIQARLDVLRSLGAHVEYVAADISRQDAADQLVAQIRRSHGRLDGIIHSAGVLRDSLIAKKTAAELEDVFAPKVAGLTVLDHATRDMELDCFVLFSSFTTVSGNAGQADYAAANAFMDAYAEYRNALVQAGQRQGRTVSLNWPLWEQGGMQIDPATREHMWRSAGLAPLATEAGMRALRQALTLDASQVAVFSGDAQRLRKQLFQASPRTKPVAPVTPATPMDAGALQAKVQAALVQGVSETLKIKRDDIDVDVEFSEFGFDSITLTGFGNALNEKYGLELSPTVFFEYPTIEGMAGFLVQEYAQELARQFALPASTPAMRPGPEISNAQTSAPLETRRRRARVNPVPTSAPVQTGAPEPIAIIGVSGRFPQSADIDALWDNLKAGRNCIGDIPLERWPQARELDQCHAGLIDDVDKFDPLFFGISPREAEGMDPQQRLLMTYVWNVIEDAGYAPHKLSGSKTALFIGTASSGYSDMLASAGDTIEGHSATGAAASIGPSRMSYLLNLHGPSEPIETACSSSLVAVHRAIMTLHAGHCDLAIVGGVNTMLSPELHMSFAKAGMLSADGRCKTFSSQADGYVRGEGVGMLMLKKLSAAERDGDHIYGLIRGSAENHGGRANSLTAPNPKAQAELIKTAIAGAGVDPRTVTYIEAHGTGTALGDPIEIQGLKSAFKDLAADQDSPSVAYCGLGSVKSNIGHLELAAGVAGIIKVLLQLKHKTLAASLHCEEVNPYIDLKDSPFYIVQQERPWEALSDEQGRPLPRRAGVSSFGFGGVNAHVVIEEYISPQRQKLAVTAGQPVAVVLSAKNEERLKEQVQQLLAVLKDGRFSDEDLADIAYTLQVGREAMEVRLACVVASMEQLQTRLAAYLQGDQHVDELYRGEVKRNKETLALFAADEDMSKAIEAWMLKGKLPKLLDLWVKGWTLDWEALYREARPQRISLPTYPFARERYWVPEAALPAATTAALSAPVSMPAPVPVAAAAVPSAPAKPSEPHVLMTFQESWVEETPTNGAGTFPGKVVCFLSDPQQQRALADELKAMAPQSTLVFVAQSEARQPQGLDHHAVALQDGNAYAQLLAQLRNEYGDIDALLYLWPLENPALVEDVSPIVHILQALAQTGLDCKRLLLAGRAIDELSLAYLESWIGIERSIHLALPKTQLSVALEAGPEAAQAWDAHDWMRRFGAELKTAKAEGVLHRNGRRHVCRVQPLHLKQGKAPLRRGGTYLITGGCGGLGLIFAEYLARNFAAQLVLTGRSAPDEEKQGRLRALQALGAEVLYAQADVADEAAMRAMLAQAAARFGVIDGVIHAAGIDGSENIVEKETAQFRQVLAPKIQGSIVLDAVLRDHPLDFVCYFSSSSATLGDNGACDYAMANRFLAAYAKARNVRVGEGLAQGKTLAIQWPLWNDGGMGFADSEQRHFYLKASGQRALETQEGIAMFEQLLGQDAVHPLVLAGQPTRVQRFLGLIPEEKIAPAVTPAVLPHGAGRQPHMKGFTFEQCVEWDLMEHASQLLKIARDRLSPEESLAEFGFDSISLAEYAKRLAAHYRIELSPAVFFSYPTLGQFGRHLQTAHRAVLEAFYQEGMVTEARQDLAAQKTVVQQVQQAAAPAAADEPIAIIGMSGRFPGARTVDELWRILREGKDVIGEIPSDRFDWREYYGDPLKDTGKTNGKWLGAVPGVDEFDPLFFEISPHEAEAMDPRQRLLLQEAWRALEDAGYGSAQLKARKTGIFAGVEQGDYQLLGGDGASITSNHDGILASRLAYALDLHGPAMAVNTACSSGLVAAHLACQSLRMGECDTAIAAAVNLLLTPQAFVGMGQAGMLSPDGKCHVFDKNANGMVPGEAVVAVVLKRLSQAQADGDPIHAVIRGSGINYDGKTNGITAPSGVAQTRLLQDIYGRYRIEPGKLDYIVTHGTGTRLGDPIEINALFDAFKTYTDAQHFCALTSTKANLGHTLAASGLVSLVGLVQAMKQEVIPPSLHCVEESDYIPWARSPFYVNKQAKAWPRRDEPRWGAVSAFGMSGTNAHMVLQSYESQERASQEAATPFILLALSAKTDAALRERARDLCRVLQQQDWQAGELRAMSYTLLMGRHHFAHRCALVIQDRDDAVHLLQRLDAMEKLPNLFHAQVARDFRAQKATLRYAEELITQTASLTQERSQYQDNLHALAELYCQGYELPWEALFGEQPPRRISLPTYPFAREHYWVQEKTTEAAESPEAATESTSAGMPPASVPQPALQQPLTAMPDVRQLYDKTLQRVKGLFGEVSKLGADRIDVEEPLERYGINSIMIVRLNQKLEEVFGELSKTLFYEYQTLSALTSYLTRDHAEVCAQWGGVTSTAMPVEQPVSSVPAAAVTAQHSMRSARQVQRKAPPETPSARMPIAIIGVSGRYPQARTIDEFWANLARGRDCISEIPVERWPLEGFFHPNMQEAIAEGKSYSKWGGFVDGFAEFDPLFFNIAPSEAESMDPQERLFLQCAYETLEDAGYTRQRLASACEGRVGVFAGITTTGFDLYGPPSWAHGIPFFPHTSFSSLTNRVSYLFNLQGPSIPIDTMCSASLTAIHEACLHLHMGECEAAIAGGVNLMLHPFSYVARSAQRMLAIDGHCKSFGAGGDGYVPGEGVGAVLLKPLAKAIEDGDRIYGVIKGSSVNHGGKTNGYTVPNPNAQAQLIAGTIKESGVHPRAISYIEAHGTGTALGDPIEITGLSKAFGEQTQDRQYCAIGSVKSNIGHCESAAGIAGLTKVLLQMKHGMLVKSLHSTELNPNIDFGKTPFVVPQENTPWQRPVLNLDGQEREYPRIAGLSSFGAGGANAHLIIEEYIAPQREKVNVAADKPVAVVLSAKNEERLQEQVEQMLAALKSGRFSEADLADIAYTLQVGREAMEVRLACVVTSMEQLQARLAAYLQGDKHLEGLYHGEVKRNKEALALFTADEDLAKAIEAWIAKSKLPKLLDLWVKGLALDWEVLYREDRPQRISLPAYPFARERYWVPAIPAAALSNNTVATTTLLHPLVHRNTSDLREQRFSSLFTGEEFFIKDHVVQGQRVLPGVAQLEMARQAVWLAVGKQEKVTRVRLENVVFAQPVVIRDIPVEVHIALESQDGGVAFEIYSGDDEEALVHCQGRAVLKRAEPALPLPLQDLKEQCPNRITAEQCYAALAKTSVSYGTSLQGVERVHCGTDSEGKAIALGEIRVPAVIADTRTQYMLHPAMLSAALQASEKLLPAGSACISALEQVDVLAPLPDNAWVLVRYSEGSHAETAQQKIDLDLSDGSGQVCVRMRGISSRVLQGTPVKADIQTMLLRPQWKPQAERDETAQPRYSAHWIVLCEMGQGAEEAVRAGMEGSHCVSLCSGSTEVAQRYTDYARQLLEQVQAILTSKPQGEVFIQLLVPVQGDGALMRGLGGILKSAHLEHSKLVWQVLMLESGSSGRELCERIKAQMHAANQDVRYNGSERQVARLEEAAQDAMATPVWKNQGVYLITGGAGGLGLIFAEAIASQARQVKLVLTGRSQPGEATQARLDVLRSLGAHVEYRAVDMSQVAAVEELIAHIHASYGGLNGVIHCAGVLRDSFILKKTRLELEEVLSAKVTGLVALDQATQGVKLDFVALCSSLTGVMGNVGQADYAAANAFMDMYAQHRNELVRAGRRSGHTVSVNWPLWEHGGMQLDEATREHMWRSTGLAPLRTEDGLRALGQAFRLGGDQALVFSGDAARLRMAVAAADAPARAKKQPAAGKPVQADDGGLQARITDALVQDVSTLLKIKREGVDPHTELSEFGFDSITLTEFSNVLNQRYGLETNLTVFFEFPTLEALAGHLVLEHHEVLAKQFASPSDGAKASPEQETQRSSVPVHTLIRRQHSRADNVRMSPSSSESEPIAIIGMNGRFPQSNGMDALWENLTSGKDCIVEVPGDRWSLDGFYCSGKDEARRQQKSHSKFGGFLGDLDSVDREFFGISEQEAIVASPKELILLETVWKLVESAGYSAEIFEAAYGSDVGVYIGATPSTPHYYGIGDDRNPGIPHETISKLAHRISNYLDLSGPSVAIDTLSSSSMMAVHMACESLRRGECKIAIAGGVCLLYPELYVLASRYGLVGSKAGSRSFTDGDGFLLSESVGAVLLKPLSQAEMDGDNILAVIKATATTHAGRQSFGGMPNPKAQKRLFEDVLAKANVNPRTISYVETAANGSPAADLIEVTGLSQVFQASTSDVHFCALGSVESNIGHAEAASGMAQLAKVVLQIRHKQLAPLMTTEPLNPGLRLEGSAFYLQRQLESWPRPQVEVNGRAQEMPRRAMVNSFGAGGAYVSAILEEYVPAEGSATGTGGRSKKQVNELSATSSERLHATKEPQIRFAE